MSIGRENYQGHKEARIERLEDRAAKAQAESTAAYQTAHEILRQIPPGQPVLVGHHSEARHRRDLARIDRAMSKSVDASEKAAYYADRAESARNNSTISSDDPEAIRKLEEKLAKLQAAQEEGKAMNAYYRKHKTVVGFPGMDDARAAEIDAALAEQDANPYSSGRHLPVQSWVLSNRNAEINRLKKRIEALRQVDEMEHTEIAFDGGVLVTNEEVNRVQILFDEKPDEATRKELKGWGFRWSPSEGAWQAPRTPRYLRRAKLALAIPELEAKPEPAAEPEQDTSAETITDTADWQLVFPWALPARQ